MGYISGKNVKLMKNIYIKRGLPFCIDRNAHRQWTTLDRRVLYSAVLFRETCYQFKKGERHFLARGLLDSFEGKKTRVRRGPIDEGCSLRKKGASRNVSFIKTSGFSKQQSTALEKRLLLNERTPCGKRASVHW